MHSSRTLILLLASCLVAEAQFASFNDQAYLSQANGSVSLPQLANLTLKLESSDFDSASNGSTVSSWSDGSGAGHNFNLTGISLLGNPAAPTVDGTILCNGHKTVRFNNNSIIGASAFSFGSGNGVEMIAVYQFDTPVVGNGAMLELMRPNNATLTAEPFTDNNFYECFGRTDRPNIGHPTSAPTVFFCYDVSSLADNSSYKVWANNDNFFSSGTYTFTANQGGTQTTVGGGYTGVLNLYAAGNLAAVYAWTVALSSTERTQARAYITSVWGITF